MNVTVLTWLLGPVSLALIVAGYLIELRLLRDVEEADPAQPIATLPLD